MYGCGVALVVCLSLVAAAGLSLAQEGKPTQVQQATIADECVAAQKLIAEGKAAAAVSHLRGILEIARAKKPEELTGNDWFAVGLAHYYLMGEAFGKAMQGGGLNEDDAALARRWHEYVSGATTGAAAGEAHAVKVIGHGQPVTLNEHIAKGKTTIFDFYSQYCPPCVAIAPMLEKLARQRQDVVVVKVDINRPGVRGIDWQSPTARQFNLHSIPHFKIYGPDGRLKAEDEQAFMMVKQMIGQLGG